VSNADSVLLAESVAAGLAKPAVEFKSPNRIQTNILAKRERKLLDELCREMPSWVTPDRLTAVGLLGATIASLGYVASNFSSRFLFLASLGLVVNWFGDSLDGSLARHRGIERPRYGYFLDHSSDAIGGLIFALGLGFSPYVSLSAALFLLCSYNLLSIHEYLLARVSHELNLARIYVGPTELRLLAIAFNFLIYFLGAHNVTAFGLKVSIYTFLVMLQALGFIVVFLIDCRSTARRLWACDNGGGRSSSEFSPSN
jgi:phosphatidylglycerophosphate synthase